jgi:hypothetical protein
MILQNNRRLPVSIFSVKIAASVGYYVMIFRIGE